MAETRAHSDLIAGVKDEADSLIVAIKGEIDLQTSPELRVALIDLLARSKAKKMILNLSQVPYMDSSAIAVLVELLKKVNARGGKIWLTELQPRVKGLLEIVRLNTIFSLAATDAEAMK